jgi:TRAP transporter TAXI family solute receptor
LPRARHAHWRDRLVLALLGLVGVAALAAPPRYNKKAPGPRAVAPAAVPFKLVTASERGTYIQIGRDIARVVAPAAEIDLQVLPSAGSAENVRRLRFEPGVKLAMVQSDVYQAFLDQASGGNREAGSLIRPLRVVMPLYNEEIYFIARADAPMNFMHEIRGAKINVGPLLSGTAMSATTLYRQMFDATLPEGQASYLSNEDALVKLTGDKSIDVVVVVAGQPAKLLADMKPEARQLVKLLKFDPRQPSSQAALKTYFAATVRAASYPNLLAEDVPGLAVKAYLVTYDYAQRSASAGQLRRFGRALCENFPQLQETGHAKWREVALALPDLGRGWRYSTAATTELRRCIANPPTAGQSAARSTVTPAARANCSQQNRVLGLCR